MTSAAWSGPIDQRQSPAYSLLQSSPAIVVLAIAIACAANFADPDLWLHVLVGRRIVHSGHIPLRDLYSYAASGLPWHNHEWLAQVVLGLSYQWFGVFGLKLIKLLCAAILVAALSMGLSTTGAPAAVQRVVLLATATGLIMQMQFRPQLFTFAMLGILMAKLAAEVYRGPARLWPLIPMFALWANLHAGCMVGLSALAVVALVSGLGEFRQTGTMRRALSIAAVTLGCAMATLLNPFGREQWLTFSGALSNPLIRAFIVDWQPLPKFIGSIWHGSPYQVIAPLVPLLLFAVFIASLAAAPVTDDAAMVAIALAFSAAAFYANRNAALAVIALSIPMARHLGLALKKYGLMGRDRTRAGPHPVAAILAAALIALASGEFSNRLKTWEPVPSGAVAFMEARGLHGNVLNDFDWGEYLIWHLAPQSRVFIDGRYELVYPDALLREYLRFLFGWPGGERVLDRYPHDFALLKPGTGAYRLISADLRWRVIYRDSVAALFARAEAPVPNAKPAGTSVADAASGSEFP